MTQGRFALFGGSLYYPAGGWFDFIARHATADDARAHAADLLGDDAWSETQWATIVDLDTNEIVERIGRPGFGQPDWDPG